MPRSNWTRWESTGASFTLKPAEPAPLSVGYARFKSPLAHQCDVARHRRHLEPLTRLWSGLANALGLVVDGWVEDELADELAGGGVDDADVAAVDQHQDGGSGVGSAYSDVVESAVVAEGDFAVGVDDVAADPGLQLIV